MMIMDIVQTLNDLGKGNLFEYGLLETCLIMMGLILLAYVINRIFAKWITKLVKVNTNVVKRLIKYIIFTLAIYGCLSMIIPLKSILNTLWGSAGIIAVVVGFAAQEAMANFVNGLLITAFKPFKVGDLVRVDDGLYQGTVVDISLRDTVILTVENTKVIIPNSIMNKAVLENVNQDHSYKANFLHLEIGYDSDLELAKQLIREECQKHPFLKDQRTSEEVVAGKELVDIHFMAFNESGIALRVKLYSEDSASGFQMLSDLREAIKKRFDEEGIEFPYPHRVVVKK